MTTKEILEKEKKENFIQLCPSLTPTEFVNRSVFERFTLTIDDVDYYIATKEIMGEEVDRVWMLKKLSQAHLLDAPYHLIKKILKQ